MTGLIWSDFTGQAQEVADTNIARILDFLPPSAWELLAELLLLEYYAVCLGFGVISSS